MELQKSEFYKGRGARYANYNIVTKGFVRVVCPSCGRGGAHRIESYQPACSCGEMKHPASNNYIECSWDEFQEYYKSNHGGS